MISPLSDEIKEIFEQALPLLIDFIEQTEDEEVAAYSLESIGAIAKAYGTAIVPDELLEKLCEVTYAVIEAEANNKE